jgi:acyl-CoA dehydrogenase
VAHQVADAYIDTEGVSLTAWHAVWLTERGEPCAEELAIAAWWAVDAAVRAMERAMHVHGGISVDMDYPAHRYYLAVKGAASLIGAPSERLAALGDLLASA